MSEFGEPFALHEHSRFCALNEPRTIQIEIRPNAHGDSEPLSREATDRIVAAVTDRLNALAGVDLANLSTIQQLALQVLTKPQEVTPLAMLVDEGQEVLGAGQEYVSRDEFVKLARQVVEGGVARPSTWRLAVRLSGWECKACGGTGWPAVGNRRCKPCNGLGAVVPDPVPV